MYIKINKVIILFLFLFLFLFAAFRDGRYFYDYYNYAFAVNNFSLSLENYLGYELGFIIIASISNLFSSPTIPFFFIFAFISLYIKFIALKKGADNFYFSLFAFFCMFYLPHELTQIRVSVAAGFFMLAFISIRDASRMGFYSNVFLAFIFHFSAFILFPMYWLLRLEWKYNFLFFLLPVFGFLFHLFGFLEYFISFLIEFSPAFLSTKIRIYNEIVLSGDMQKIKIFNYNFILYLMLFLLFTMPFFSKKNKILIRFDLNFLMVWRLMCMAIFFYFSLSYVSVFSFRIYELLSVPVVFSLYSISHYYVQKMFVRVFVSFLLILFLFLNFFKLVLI